MSSIEQRKERKMESKSYEKLARLCHLFDTGCDESRIEECLDLEGHIDFKVPDGTCPSDQSNPGGSKPLIAGNTALHLAVEKRVFKPCQLLIDRGANLTIKNGQDLTPIHILLRDVYKDHFLHRGHNPFITPGKLQEPIIDLLIAAQVQQRNPTNPQNPHGISHFHVACMANHVESVEFFLNNQVPINESINADSSMFPGFSPLHLAVRLDCLEIVNVLLSRGADVLARDPQERTPLHLAIQRYMPLIQLYNLRLQHRQTNRWGWLDVDEEDLLARMETVEKIIASILSKFHETTIERTGLSAYYVMYRSKQGSLSLANINEQVAMDSPFWPGYTALHFAARVADVDTFKRLLNEAADIEATDANGDTPFDFCVGSFDVEHILDIFSTNDKWCKITLTDGQTKLVDLLRAMRNSSELTRFLDDQQVDVNNISIPMDSPLWAGATILHLAVMLTKKCVCIEIDWDYTTTEDSYNCTEHNQLVELCVDRGADVCAQDARGSTPIHIAYRRYDLENVRLLLKHHESSLNPVDKDNLSHLHIACALRKLYLVNKLTDAGADVNVAVYSSFQWDWKVRCAHKISLNEHFIFGAGSTPLHVAVSDGDKALIKLLLGAGADVHARDVNGRTPIHLLLSRHSSHVPSLQEIFQCTPLKDVSRDCTVNGLNYLHIAVHTQTQSSKVIEKLLHLGADVNSAIVASIDSSCEDDFCHIARDDLQLNEFKCYEGDTPLHLCFRKNDTSQSVIRTLITEGADVLAKNAIGWRPIHWISRDPELLKFYMNDVMMDQNEKRFNDELGMTRLHMACMLFDKHMIKDCLKDGANVNAQIRSDSKCWAGFTPLHFLVDYYWGFEKSDADSCKMEKKRSKKSCKLVSLLLNNGADLTIADANGNTPLLLNIPNNHMNVKSTPHHIEILMDSLSKKPVNSINKQGISHFHLACIRKDASLMKKFLKRGVDVNQAVDYFSNDYSGFTPLHFAVMDRHSGLRALDDSTSLKSELKAVHLLMEYGANVHASCTRDRTPLQIAAELPSTLSSAYKKILNADPKTTDMPASEFEKIREGALRIIKEIPITEILRLSPAS